MNKHEESEYEMLESVDNLLDANLAVTASIPAIKTNQDKLKEVLAQIKKKGGKLLEDHTGKTKAKHVTISELIHDTLVVAGSIFCYAASISNTELMAEFDLGERDFTRERIDEIPIKARNVLDKADELLINLADFGITEQELNKLRADLDEVDAKTNLQGTGYQDKGTARTILTDLFEKSEEIIVVLDKLMRRFAKVNPEFYAKYKIGRTVKTKASGSRNKKEGGEEEKPNTTGPTPTAG